MRVELWDVFTDRPLAGNALAVVYDEVGLSSAAMQRLAREFDLSETVFVRVGPDGPPRLRIFTPARELPTAGHPTIGATFSLDRRGRLGAARAELRLAAGVVALGLERTAGGALTRVWMDQGRPGREAVIGDRRGVAAALGLAPTALPPGLPLEVWSAGNPFLIVPLLDLDRLAAASLALGRLAEATRSDPRALLAFVPGDGQRPLRCRMFGAALGVVEDPGTGSAHGPLAAYLLRHGLTPPPSPDAPVETTSRQGVEMGRPSTLRMRLHALPPDAERDPALADATVEVGGTAVPVLEGRLLVGGEEAPA